MAETISLLLQVLLWPLCLGMIGLILLQGGAGDISSAFGGGGMLDSTLGVGASKKMAKVTGWLAAAFFAFVLFLAIPHKGGFGVPVPAEKNTTTAPVGVAAPNAPVQSAAPVVPPVVQSAPVLAPVSTPKLEAPAAVIEAAQSAAAAVGAAGTHAAGAVDNVIDHVAAPGIQKGDTPVHVEAPPAPAAKVEAPAVVVPAK